LNTNTHGAGDAPPPEVQLAQAFALHREGRLDEAERLYREVLVQRPDHPEALHHLGLIRHQQGDAAAGIDLIQQAIALDSGQSRYFFNLALMLETQGRPRQAAIARASGCLRAGQPEQARAILQSLLAAAPDDPLVHLLEGEIHSAAGRWAEAVAAYRKAAELDPARLAAWLGLATAAEGQCDYDQALAALERAETLDPASFRIAAQQGLLHYRRMALADSAAAYRRAVALAPERPELSSALLYTQHTMTQAQVGDLTAAHRAWGEALERRVTPYRDWPNAPDPERTLRLGIVSPDFKAHPDGQFLLGLLRQHDPADLEIVCYSEVQAPDFITQELRGLADGWVRIHRWSDAAVAERLRADRIDILLDPTGHQGGNRLPMHARKPVPLQVAKVGYLCTRGLRAFDYYLGDPLMTPAALQDQFVETLWPLPGRFLYYPPPRFHVPVVPPPCLAHGYVTFGSFNNAAKLDARCIDVWSRVLRRVPTARLYLRAPYLADEGNRRRLRTAFAAQGIAAARLEFGGGSKKLAYLADFGRIDIHLDTLTLNGVTTTCDALWMGVPVVAHWGQESRNRVAATLVHHAGHAAWGADTDADYVDIAVALANDPRELATIRARLRDELAGSPICDGPGHARALTAALREMWRRWCNDGPPTRP